jgi:uncharacterized protein YjbI with pentapeptide repeats
MANREQLERLKHDVVDWNRWRKENPSEEIDLEEANLSGFNTSVAKLETTDLRFANLSSAKLCRADLSYTCLYGANLREANLSKAMLWGSDLSEASLCNVNLREAGVQRVDLSRADLKGANLCGANLFEPFFFRTDLRGADLGGALIRGAVFSFIDLSETKGLEETIHSEASSISVDTLYLSKAKIPVKFLRGCGLSDLDIEYAKLAAPGLDSGQVTDITYKIHQLYLGVGIQYYSCFISYNNRDEEFAKLLHDDLQNNGVRCWFALEDMRIGDQIRPAIDRQIRLRDKLLVILSKNSIASEWVGDEVEEAIEEEQKSNRIVLFPLRLDDAVMNAREDWAAKIRRRRHIGDFSNWRDKNSYLKAFERLLKDLKAMGGEA